ncbi:MAGUK p55 subfamily member 5 [Eurytemora carolleeae]|uniref:MAGUK p55 subfamily member 5 n=1 Tax=Eurytemora carolleeae TaxID=1294199 RepID=UPI000C7871DC|nr:MAGUK p55 subfamily member 5 [Eurytemora carolleeae]|eukprot:XP_023337454.1 MAGUK p55 subfamily member 5-like [Eurytemora affinis]
MTETMQLKKQNSGGYGSSGSSQENISSKVYSSANYNTIMVEFENGNREMAVDVPASFIAQAKTPPRYPPSNPRYQATLSTFSPRGTEQNSSTSSRQSKESSSNGSIGMGPPPTGSRDHLKIEKDGRLINRAPAPDLPGRDGRGGEDSRHSGRSSGQAELLNGSSQPHSADYSPVLNGLKPSQAQYDRIAKYTQELKQHKTNHDAKLLEEAVLRSSLRNSARLRALENSSNMSSTNNNYKGVNNPGFSTLGEETPQVSLGQVHSALNRLKNVLPRSSLDALYGVAELIQTPEFEIGLDVYNKLQSVWCYTVPPPAVCVDAQELAEDCLSLSDGGAGTGLEHEPAAAELAAILRKESLEGLLYAHDKLAERYCLLNSLGEEDVILDRVSHYAEPNIKVVKLEKTSEPLGATVKNEGEAVIVGRIIRGGAADRSGLLHEGDEILEVNEVELRGKNVNEVCDILARMTGTLTMLVVPIPLDSEDGRGKVPILHLKAQIDYEAEEDQYVPCRELGISFHKGDILHIINQDDPHWWQAYREGEENALAGLIPSPSFHSQRVQMKQTIAEEVGAGERGMSRQKSGLLCARRSNKRKKKEVPYSSVYHEDFEGEEPVVYEEVSLYYPRPNRKRPIVLIGPPNIGRHELRQRLMRDAARFAAAIPHTSRTRRDDETDGQDYHFITRLQFEQDILARRFVEHGEYEKAYYGTSLEAIRAVVNLEKICVLNLHPQSLRILKNSDLMPYVVFVAPPSLVQLKRWKMENLEQVDDEELEDIIKRAREMEERYGHYFDMIIIYSDPDRAYQSLVEEINLLEREPQWVPGSWLKQDKGLY